MSTAILESPSIVGSHESSSVEKLAHNVRFLRFQRRMSVSELARKSGLSRQILYMIENGTANLRMNSLERLAIALGVEVCELLG